MSDTQITLRFSIIVSDTDHWDKDHIEAAENDTQSGSYADWVQDQLSAVMRKAADQFINENDDLFRLKEII